MLYELYKYVKPPTHAISRSFGLKLGQNYFHFVLKLVVILHSVLNVNVLEHKLRKRHKSRQALFRHGAMILNCNRGYYTSDTKTASFEL